MQFVKDVGSLRLIAASRRRVQRRAFTLRRMPAANDGAFYPDQLAGMRRFNCTARTVVKLMNVEVTA